MNTRRTLQSVLTAGLIFSSLLGAVNAHASVVIAGTRAIYNAQEKEATIKLSNEGKTPALTQAWIDNGDADAEPSAIEVPFLVTPPMMRIDPSKAQTLRILHSGEPMAQDKETLFWLNVLEIPPNPDAATLAADENTLQLAIRTRIKLFYRPAKLKGTAQEAPAQIAWRMVQSGKQQSLEARNPTPYHVSFTALEVTGAGNTATFEDGGMVGPGETRQFPLKGEVSPGPDLKVHYHAINDYGGDIDGEAVPAR